MKETQDLITAFRGGHCSGGFIGVVFCQVRTSSNSAPPKLRPYSHPEKDGVLNPVEEVAAQSGGV